jgi:Neuraminidase (sialidase)
VWESTDSLGGAIGTDADILFARSTDNGASWTAPAPLNSNAGSDTGFDGVPVITTDGQGNWIAAWKSTENLGGSIGTDQDILFSRSINNGESWSLPAPLNGNAAIDAGFDDSVEVAADDQGHFVAVWRSQITTAGSGSDGDIFVAVSMNGGMTWTSPAFLNTTGVTDTGGDDSPHIATDRQGNWLAAWTSNDTFGGTIGTDSDILCARSSDNGMTWTDPTPINTTAATDTGDDFGPRIATDGQGAWLVVWESNENLNGQTGTERDILLARSDNNGETWADPAPVNNNATTDPGVDELPSITSDGHGNWMASWDGNNTADGMISTEYDVFVAHSTDNGATWTDPEALNANASGDTGDDYFAWVFPDGRGNWVAAWESTENVGGQIGTDYDILTFRFAFPDCNANGIGDGQDIADGASADCNANGIPDSCETDSDGDGIIDACETIGITRISPVCGTCAPGILPAVGLALVIGLIGRVRRRYPADGR